ncbi:hypothetical protein N7445_009629 [Penicillium cf. griseofulvum]|nr:hypothetical protein N7445_009629 [Penicillium cf. griseofulvum]
MVESSGYEDSDLIKWKDIYLFMMKMLEILDIPIFIYTERNNNAGRCVLQDIQIPIEMKLLANANIQTGYLRTGLE